MRQSSFLKGIIDAVAYVYFEEEPGRRSAAKMRSKVEARRIAAHVAKLLELLRKERRRYLPSARSRSSRFASFSHVSAIVFKILLSSCRGSLSAISRYAFAFCLY